MPMHASKRIETMSVRIETELAEFVDRYCLCEGVTHSDYLRDLILQHQESERKRWEKLRPVFQSAQDLQEKLED